MPDESPAPFLELTLNESETRVFATPEDAKTWIQQERENWAWLEAVDSRNNLLRNLWAQAAGKWSSALSAIDSYVSAQDEEQRTEQLRAARNQIVKLYSQGLAVSTTDRIYQRICQYRDAMPIVAAWAVYFLAHSDAQPPPNESDALRGFLLLELNRSVDARVAIEGEKGALVRVEEDWKRFREQAERGHSESVTTWNRHSSALSKLRKENDTEFAEFKAHIENQFSDLRDLYEKQLQLRAPVSYWTGRASELKERTKSLSWIFFPSVILTGGALVTMLLTLGTAEAKVWELLKDHPGILLAAFTAGALLIWPVRLIYRMLLSTLHLLSEADERVISAKTYLALLEDERVSESDRKLVLEVLLRPSAIGLLKDEGGQASAQHWFSRVLSGDR